MGTQTVPEVLEKWSHIAMKIFPPQTKITALFGSDYAICVRWKSENDPHALSARARGVDIHFPQKMLAEYLEGDAETQLKRDTSIESAMSERLRTFDPYKDILGTPQVEEWLIGADRPSG